MKSKIFIFVICFIITEMNYTGQAQQYKDPAVDTGLRVADLLSKMTLDEKIDLLSGSKETGFDTRENQRLGIPSLKMTDGPLGVRWGKATSFPCGAAVAATWDTTLVARFGSALAEETRAKGRNMLLGPCVNIHRFPAGGRNFESYGEDPWLASRLAVSYIKALQARGVIATVKHFALNNQEWRRTEVDVTADERTMREIYLPAFEAAVKEAGVYSVMSAYNKVNGWWCSENSHLLTDILKNEWKFQGFVVSDWVSTHSTEYAVKNGLDLEMPDAVVFTSDKLKGALKEGKITENMIDEKVRRIIRVMYKAGLFDKTPQADTSVLTGEAHKKLALDIARESVVLLKNENNILPVDLSKLKRIAVIGPNAAVARVGGGGSSRVNPIYSITPLEGIRQFMPDDAGLVYALGDELLASSLQPVEKQYFTHGANLPGLKAEYFNNTKLEGKPHLSRVDSILDFNWEDNSPAEGIGKDQFSVRWTGFITPPLTRKYTFYTASDDGVRLFINGKKVIDDWTDHGTTVDSAAVELIAGKPVEVKAEFYENGGSAVMTLAWDLPVEKKSKGLIAEAVNAAKGADVAIVFAGTSDSFESEGFDRIGGLSLPGDQDALISAVAEVNKNTIVVLNTGTPVITRGWLNKIPALLEAFFPGQEGGKAIAEVLTGRYNPSGKLPFTFISGYDQTPAYQHYMNKDLKAPYAEGIFVGYRYLDKNNLVPSFPFGHGLSYTVFEYSDLKINQMPGNHAQITLKVKNTGKVPGAEVVQLYVAPAHGNIARPVKELKAFGRVELLPGQEKLVTLQLDHRSFSYFDVKLKQWRVEPGNYQVLAGSSSADIRLKGTILMK